VNLRSRGRIRKRTQQTAEIAPVLSRIVQYEKKKKKKKKEKEMKSSAGLLE